MMQEGKSIHKVGIYDTCLLVFENTVINIFRNFGRQHGKRLSVGQATNDIRALKDIGWDVAE
jgi:hypothetical protein